MSDKQYGRKKLTPEEERALAEEIRKADKTQKQIRQRDERQAIDQPEQKQTNPNSANYDSDDD